MSSTCICKAQCGALPGVQRGFSNRRAHTFSSKRPSRTPYHGQPLRDNPACLLLQTASHRLQKACRATPEAADAPLVAVEGDLVTLHFTCKGPEGEVLETTKEAEPISFEIGAGEIMGNALFQAFDGAVRGLPVGSETAIEAQGGDWKRELLFTVPRKHPEVERLEGRYKNQGGLQQGQVVELANGSMALVVAVADDEVTLDANNMMAGKTLTFELELVGIDKQAQ